MSPAPSLYPQVQCRECLQAYYQPGSWTGDPVGPWGTWGSGAGVNGTAGGWGVGNTGRTVQGCGGLQQSWDETEVRASVAPVVAPFGAGLEPKKARPQDRWESDWLGCPLALAPRASHL